MKVTVCLKIYKDIDIDLSEKIIDEIADNNLYVYSIPKIRQLFEENGGMKNIEIVNMFCEEKDKYIFED